MKGRRKKKRTVRDKGWLEEPDRSFTHDLKKHRRTNTAFSDLATVPDIPEDFEPNGLVISHSKKWAFVLREGKEERCRISDYLVEDQSTILASGDRVLIRDTDEGPIVAALAERTTKLSRLAVEQSRVAEQVFAANIDVLVVVASVVKPKLKVGLLDRYLIAAEAGGVKPILCINKMDLVDAEPSSIQAYRDLGIPVILTSCENRDGIDELYRLLHNKTAVFAGQSGVGKSSILNVLDPGLDITTREVSDSTNKGKHTTTIARLYEFDDGIRIIDTPGIRQLGLWQVSPEEVTYYFPEISAAGENCKFRDCTHIHEPDCAVREAVDTGKVTQARYDSYLRIRETQAESDR